MLTESAATYIAIAYCLLLPALYRKPLWIAATYIIFRAAFQIFASKGYMFLGLVPWFTPIALTTIAVIAFNLYLNPVRTKLPVPFVLYGIFSMFVIAVELIKFESWDDLLELVISLSVPAALYLCVFGGIKRVSDVDKALKLFLLAMIVPAAAGLYQFFIAGGGYSIAIDDFIPDFRITGSIIDPNLYGIFLCMMLFAVIALLMRGERSAPYLMAFAAVAGLIVLAQNRGSWIAVAAALAIAVAVFHRHLNIARWIAGALALAVVATPIVIARFENLNEVDQYGQSQDTLSSRLDMQTMLLEESASQPFFGLGYGQSVNLIHQSTGISMPPHNDFIRVISEAGYFNFLLYLCFILSIAISPRSVRRGDSWKMRFALVGFGSYVVIISTAQNLLYDLLIYPAMMYLIAVAHKSFSPRQARGKVWMRQGAIPNGPVSVRSPAMPTGGGGDSAFGGTPREALQDTQ